MKTGAEASNITIVASLVYRRKKDLIVFCVKTCAWRNYFICNRLSLSKIFPEKSSRVYSIVVNYEEESL